MVKESEAGRFRKYNVIKGRGYRLWAIGFVKADVWHRSEKFCFRRSRPYCYLSDFALRIIKGLCKEPAENQEQIREQSRTSYICEDFILRQGRSESPATDPV